MARRKTMDGETCPVARTLAVVGERWSLLIVRDAFDGLRRFGDFQRSLGMARNILADRLRSLVEAGVLAVQPASDGSAYQEYILTPKGEALFPVVVALRQWGEHHLFAPGEAVSRLVEADSGEAVAPLLPRSSRGEVLTPARTRVEKPVAPAVPSS